MKDSLQVNSDKHCESVKH